MGAPSNFATTVGTPEFNIIVTLRVFFLHLCECPLENRAQGLVELALAFAPEKTATKNIILKNVDHFLKHGFEGENI